MLVNRMEAIDESFSAPEIDRRLVWTHRPPVVAVGSGGLTIETAADTDLWQRTHYGFQRDTAHALSASVSGDFRLETCVTFEPAHQYDQAGLLVWISTQCWLKTSIEFEPDAPSRLGSVVTNAAWSDWATQDISSSVREARYRITRSAGDYVVEFGVSSGAWTQLRMAHLHEDDGSLPVRAGLYACSPKSRGLRATFRFLKLEPLQASTA